MEHIIDIKSWGRMFTVPCSVVDEHIKLADGKHIKVLLCILCGSTNKIQSQKIAEQAGISIDEVEDAIAYWQQSGIISVEGSKAPVPVENIATSEPKIEKTNMISTVEAINPAPNSISKKTTVKYSPKDIEKLADASSGLKFLFDNVQTILKRPITYTEQSSLINIHEYYGFSVGVILMLFDYCENIGKTSIAYVEAIARSWFENDITTHEAAENEIIRLIDKNTFEKKVASAFGLTTRLTPKQKEYIHSWMEMGLSIDLINYAYEKCVDSLNKLQLPYINKILISWHEKGFQTRAQVDSDDTKTKPEPQKKSSHSYDLDEFYQMALDKYKK